MMKKLSTSVISLALLASLAAACGGVKGVVKNPARLKEVNSVAVLPFACDRDDFVYLVTDSTMKEIGCAIADSLINMLRHSRFEIIERSQVERILTKQGFGLTDLVMNQEYVIREMQYMLRETEGIDAIIVGNVIVSHGSTDWGFPRYVEYVSRASARVIDLKSGADLMVVTFKSNRAGTHKGVMTPRKVGHWIGNEIMQKAR